MGALLSVLFQDTCAVLSYCSHVYAASRPCELRLRCQWLGRQFRATAETTLLSHFQAERRNNLKRVHFILRIVMNIS